MQEEPIGNVVDLGFQIAGDHVPLDHGYQLYAALCQALPALHGAPWLSIHPISGDAKDSGRLALREGARLILRLPSAQIPTLLPLAGRTLSIGAARIALGMPNVSALVPAACLDARLVVLKLTNPPLQRNEELQRDALNTKGFAERYDIELRRQLGAIGIAAAPALCGRRRILVVGKRVVGYSVRVGGLDATQSLALQVKGLGGKHRMGCGVFRPTRGA